MATDATTWASVLQDVGLGAALALGIYLLLKKVLADAQLERDRYREERKQFLDALERTSGKQVEAISQLEKTLFELRGAILGSDLEQKDKE